VILEKIGRVTHRTAHGRPILTLVRLHAASSMKDQPPALRVLLALFGAVLVLYGLLATSGGCRSCGVTGDTLLGYLKDPSAIRSLSSLFLGFGLQWMALWFGFIMMFAAFDND
jgi:hypothetical protein